MTVLEAVRVLKSAEQITLGYGGGMVPFDKDNPLMLDAYGGYIVEEITYCDPGWYEIDLAVRPFKEA